ncbi:hypothetical protein JXA85_02045 [Candidatus Woesearchaeota archaeon]|nr:hypothetical protein [Candidatus Woesearchaeota archaeon]
MNQDERRKVLELIRQNHAKDVLHVVLLPLNMNSYHVYLDNIREFIESEKNLEGLVVSGFRQTRDLDALCRDVASSLREQKQNYPVNLPFIGLSKKDKTKYIGAIAAQFMPEQTPVVGKLSKKAREWLGNGGATLGGVAGYVAAADPFSAIICAGIGYMIGYCTPIIYGATGLIVKNYSVYRQRKDNKIIIQRNICIREKIDKIADRIYYQEVPVQLQILQVFSEDNVQSYINGRWSFPRARVQRNCTEHRAFSDVLSRISENDMSYSLRRYYKTKLSDNDATL